MLFKKLITVLLLLTSIVSYAGVVLFADVPEALKVLRDQAQAIVQEELVKLNARSKAQQFLFEADTYKPHITLSYISSKKLSLEEIKCAEPQLLTDLSRLAKRLAIDMAASLKTAQLIIWPGKYESEYQGKKYKKSAILVITIKPTEPLIKLVEDIDAAIEPYAFASKRVFTFKPHVTIGYVYDEKDVDPAPLVQAVTPALEKLIAEFKTSQSFTIESFTLSAHDDKQVNFALGTNTVIAD